VNDNIIDIRQRLTELNRLEDDGAMVRRSGHSALNSEALMESLRANVPVGVLVQHDRLRSRGRQSIAEVRNGVCSGCHMNLPIGVQAEVQRQSTLLKCGNCGRFIFPVEEESTPARPTATPKKQPISPRSTKP
jgi:uncharacterized protein